MLYNRQTNAYEKTFTIINVFIYNIIIRRM